MQDFLMRMNIPYLMSKWDNVLPLTALITLYVIAVLAACHALLNKRESRAALGWVVVCLGFPGLGVLAYILFGVNRIKSRAQDWQTQDKWGITPKAVKREKALQEIETAQQFDHDTFRALMSVSNAVTRRPLVKGCCLQAFHNAEQAYGPMLKAIASAEHSIYLCTYIFENNKSGKEFADALASAAKRGVDVKIIIDGIGIFYSFPTIFGYMKNLGLNVVKFLPPSISKRSIHLNLRNHRKILVVDSQIGFTGGMNIGDSHFITRGKKRSRVCDIHFRVQGPVVAHLEETFQEDWYFVTGEKLVPPTQNKNEHTGDALCRGITAGPNEDFEDLRWIVNGALCCAKKNVRIMTPYFIPDDAMASAILTARLKGIQVDIILPHVNNLPYVGWASQAYLDEFLKYDVKIYYRPMPFAHGKILVVDDFYILLGSANLDPRSLRLNFEFNMEVYDKKFAGEMITHFDEVKNTSIPITIQRMQNRKLIVKLRDSFFKIFSPYL